ISPQEVMHDEAFIASQILDEYFIRERIRVNLVPFFEKVLLNNCRRSAGADINFAVQIGVVVWVLDRVGQH
ncbi:MAG: hypothetical protein ACPGAB_02440, partial [Flavobacteriales bacterium]